MLKFMNFLRLFLLFALFSISLEAATIIVGPPPASIQTAINNASNGDTIQLSAGTYVEEIEIISKSLNIIGVGEDVSIIQSPPPTTHLTQKFVFGGTNWWCVVMVDNQLAPAPQTVNFSALTIDADQQQDTSIPPIYGSSDRFFCVGYHNANGTIGSTHITNPRQSTNFNELAGGGILFAADVGIVRANIVNNLVDFYQRIAIDCRGAALTAAVTGNTTTRGYITPGNVGTTPNGIQLSNGAQGYILQNIVSGNIDNQPNAGGLGIIVVSSAPNITIAGNIVNNNDNGIAAIGVGNNLRINNNILNFTIPPPGNTPEEGIIVADPQGSSAILFNIINDIPDVNMDLSSPVNETFQLMGNQINGSTTGIFVTGISVMGPQITMNQDSFSGTTGDFILENGAPNDIWPSTASVSFNGLVSGSITLTQFNQLLTQIVDQHSDPTLGLVLDYIPQSTPAPTVTSVVLATGPISGGNSVTITGTNFISSNTTVNFGSVSARNSVVSNTSITATVPPGLTLGTVNVTVTTPFGTSAINPGDQYTYTVGAPNPPQIDLLNLNYGSFNGGNTITVTGTGFINGVTSVSFGGVPGTNVVVNSNQSLTIVAPEGTNSVTVTATTPYGTSLPSDGSTYYYIFGPPAVTSLSPNFGPEAGGTVITITGSGFVTGNSNVYFGSTQATAVVINSSTNITATSPPGTSVVNVTVVTPFGTSPIVPADQFTYIKPSTPLPPSNFVGIVLTNQFLTFNEYLLKATFDPSPSPDVTFYHIYKNDTLVKVIPAGSSLTFKTFLKKPSKATQFSVTAVTSSNIESTRVPIQISELRS